MGTQKNNPGVSVKKSAKEVIANFTKSSSGLLITNLGAKKSSIYNEELFENCTDKEKKSLRRKFRNILLSVAKSIVSEKNEEKRTKLVNAFNEFYLDTFKVNDFSLESVCNENLSTEKKEVVKKSLEICKKVLS